MHLPADTSSDDSDNAPMVMRSIMPSPVRAAPMRVQQSAPAPRPAPMMKSLNSEIDGAAKVNSADPQRPSEVTLASLTPAKTTSTLREEAPPEKPGFFAKLFGKAKQQEATPLASPPREEARSSAMAPQSAAPPAPQPAPTAPPVVRIPLPAPAPAAPPRIAAPASRPVGLPNRERVEAALRYLARNQSASGSFGDAGLTRLIVEAFAVAGETAKKGLYRRQLGRAEAFLATAVVTPMSQPAPELQQLLAAQLFGGAQDGAVVGAGETMLMTALLVKLLCAAGL
jgi:hypothetical protein